MNILITFGFPLRIGGHFKSALAFIKKLTDLGHRFIILAPGGYEDMIREFEGIGAKCYFAQDLLTLNRFPQRSLILFTKKLCRENGISLIHAQDYNAIYLSYAASVLLKLGFVYTQAGGALASRGGYPPQNGESVVYSQELRSGFISRYGLSPAHVTLIRARIDSSVYKPEQVSEEFIKKYALPVSGKKIVMAIRFAREKTLWLSTLMQLADTSSRHELKIIVAGEGSLLAGLEEFQSRINRERRSSIAVHLIGPITKPGDICQLYNYADIIVGNGRGILEAMACRKPVIVLGEKGEGETITPETVNKIAEFNFSGRHFRFTQSSAEAFPEKLINLIDNQETLEQLSHYAYQYIQDCMDSRIGAQQLNDVYTRALKRKNSVLDYGLWIIKALKDRIL